jgi:endonuclease/exonuclease/phosphatase family metal-dependent hydrolase
MKKHLGSSAVLGFTSLCFAACQLSDDGVGDDPAALAEMAQAVTIPAKGSATTLDVGSWNLEFFGDPANGPTNDALQLSNVRDVIAGTNFDIWGVEEVVNVSTFNSLISQLSGYAGFLANDPSVVNGPQFYSDFNNQEQKVGLLFKTSIVTVLSAQVILTQNDFDFAGRPPLEVKVRITLNGATEDDVIIVMHPKCCADSTSYQRRVNASNALKTYLDTTYPTQKVWVIGDWNDDVDTSIFTGNPSPYANFVNDSAHYTVQTKVLSDAGLHSTVNNPDVIDHHMNTNELAATFISGSAEIYRVDSFITSYGTTTSDHFPVLTRYNFGGTPNVILNEILANEPGSDTAGEFVEIVNVGTASANLSGWTVSDATQVRHTFASGTSLAAGKAIVVFAGASAIPTGLSNAVAASTGSLSLANAGDTVALKSNTGTVIQSFTYPSSLAGTDGVSMNRNPDATANGSFVLHTTLSSLSSSPGKHANGTAF